jgi:ABC-2 type transport system permease protein
MKTFTTLLHREWMQHKFGWTVVVLVPLVIAVLLLGVGHMQFSLDDAEFDGELARAPAVALALGAMLALAGITFVGAWATSLIQAPGLARRDRQDRSIEFWLSLPTGHASSVAAPLLAHFLLFPAAALFVGLLGGQLIALALVTKVAGLGAWFALPWGTVLVIVVSLLLRTLLGLVLATLWLSPMVLLTMAASAWLKRWGLPALIGGVVIAGNVLDKLYGNPVVWEVISALGRNAGLAMISSEHGPALAFPPGVDPTETLNAFPAFLWADAMQALAALANPLLAGALLASAACFGLLVLRRRRGA